MTSTPQNDPVCGMAVDPATAKHRVELAGQAYVFCCEGCKAKFLADPIRFAKSADKSDADLPRASATPRVTGTIYTFPMHPQIRRNAPRQLSHLRHGAGARRHSGNRRLQS